MKAVITEKPGIRVKQFAWDNQILYLHIKDVGIGKSEYYIKDTPLESNENLIYITTGTGTSTTTMVGGGSINFNNQFQIKTPIGKLETNFSSAKMAGFDLSEQLKKNEEMINMNIDYLQNLKEVLDYIQMLEAEYAK